MTVTTFVGVVVGVAVALDADEPRHWGTFTEESCAGGGIRHRCQSIGTWLSDDGEIRLTGVALDGTPGSDGMARAQYQPTGVLNDADSNIVHSSTGAMLEPVAPWILVALGGGTAVMQLRKWRGTWR